VAKPTVDAPADVVERNVGLTEKIMRFLLDRPQVFSSLPDEFELVVLPDDDPAQSTVPSIFVPIPVPA
jgi:hypothetical protein